MLNIFFLTILTVWLRPSKPATLPVNNYPAFHYLLDQPDQVFKMPKALKEISGLSLTADGQQIAANNDEQGIIFLLNKETGHLEQEIDFLEKGDYEGIEIVGLDAYVVKSSGAIYRVSDYASDKRKTKKSDTFLSKESDVEGLAYDLTNHRLLVACKGHAAGGKEAKQQKAVYGFDLDAGAISPEPLFVLSLPDIRRFLEQNNHSTALEKLLVFFSEDAKQMGFSPSGIALHPFTCDVYILSSSGKMLLVCSPKGEILFLEKLKKSIHHQPEGICFDQDGALFIANEGQDGPGKIYKFSYRN